VNISLLKSKTGSIKKALRLQGKNKKATLSGVAFLLNENIIFEL